MIVFTPSTMNRVLAIPELLDMIFQFLDTASNVLNATVCKQWSNSALDVLWREVKDLYRLFSLLAPLEICSEGSYKFVRGLESADWRRFERYKFRVRTLSYSVAMTRVAHPSVFDDVARSRTSLDILPSMHTLEWDAPLTLCVMFMHKNVRFFTFDIPSGAQGVGPFFKDVVDRMPNITHLDLRFAFPIRTIDSEVAIFLSSFKRLQKVTFPRFCFTTTVAESMSRLEDLGIVEFQYYANQGRGDPSDTMDFRPSLTEGCFPSLWDLSLTTPYDTVTRWFDMPFAPINLTSLHVESPTIEEPNDVFKLISILTINCQLLKSLTLVSYIDASSVLPTPMNENCLSIATIRPLFKCPNLTSLDISHHLPMDLQQGDIEEIATSWPSAESLCFNNEPASVSESTLTLRALLPFARHCPVLHTLRLFINATTADLPSASDCAYYPFQSLRVLSFGVSIIHEEGKVALFLSQICPLQCGLECGITWDVSLPVAAEIARTIRDRYDKWSKVIELLPLLTKLRMEERERARMLKREVEDLRIRTSVLMDKVSLATNDLDGCIAV